MFHRDPQREAKIRPHSAYTYKYLLENESELVFFNCLRCGGGGGGGSYAKRDEEENGPTHYRFPESGAFLHDISRTGRGGGDWRHDVVIAQAVLSVVCVDIRRARRECVCGCKRVESNHPTHTQARFLPPSFSAFICAALGGIRQHWASEHILFVRFISSKLQDFFNYYG